MLQFTIYISIIMLLIRLELYNTNNTIINFRITNLTHNIELVIILL